MSFISYKYKHDQSYTDCSIYSIMDSEFGEAEILVSNPAQRSELTIAVVKTYIARNLHVGKNMALLTIFLHKKWAFSIDSLVEYQDIECPRSISNWKQYAKERDEHLAKLLPLL